MRYHLTYIHFNFSTFVTSKQIKYLARKHTKHTWFQLANIHSNGCRYFIKWWQSLLIVRSFSSFTSCGFFYCRSRIQIEMWFNDNGEQLKIIWNYSHSFFFHSKSIDHRRHYRSYWLNIVVIESWIKCWQFTNGKKHSEKKE